MTTEDDFESVIKKWHERLGTTNKCYILNCGQIPTVALMGVSSGKVHFYCARCADEVMKTRIFQRVKND